MKKLLLAAFLLTAGLSTMTSLNSYAQNRTVLHIPPQYKAAFSTQIKLNPDGLILDEAMGQVWTRTDKGNLRVSFFLVNGPTVIDIIAGLFIGVMEITPKGDVLYFYYDPYF